MEKNGSFEVLAGEISTNERLEMLKRLESSVDPATQVLEPPVTEESEKGTIEIKLRTESVFLRVWLYIKSLFSSSNINHEYGKYLLAKKATLIERNFPNVINYKKGFLANAFYINLSELQRTALFFKPSISLYEENPGKFYVYLGSLLLPDFSLRADEHLNFSLLPTDKEPGNELRSMLLRQLDDLVQQIPLAARNNLYSAVKSVEWLKNFAKLPFDHFLTRFLNISGAHYHCPLDSVTSDLTLFSKVLCNGSRIRSEVLEALATFSAAAQGAEEESDLREKSAIILKKSIDHIAFIKVFITAIPLRTITAMAHHSVFWEPEALEGAEDWFVKFKTQWRKKFERQWDLWIKERSREDIEAHVIKLLAVSSFPQIPNRPWADILDGISFAHELSIGFLHEFFKKNYQVYNKTLRVLMAEGEFVQRENRMEFTDTYSDLNHLALDIERFNAELAPTGERGKLFTKIAAENIRTIHGKSQIDAIMLSLESEASLFVANFSSACRSLLAILGGITDEVRDVKYGTLQNIATIQGKLNTTFRSQIKTVRYDFLRVANLLESFKTMDI